MRTQGPGWILALAAVVALALVTGCDDGGGLQQAAPRVGWFFISNDGTLPADDQWDETPGDGVITLAFGLTDVDTINRRYVVLYNTGRSNLILSGAEMEAGSSGDFYLACKDEGQFVRDCPYSTEDYLSVAPGTALVVEVSYAPRDVGQDSGSALLTLNAADHGSITLDMTGEGVTPEIQVCASDCTGDQAGAGCSGASEPCNDTVLPNNLWVEFGDASMTDRFSRDVHIRNQGDRPLQISGLMITGDYNQFALDKNGADLPGVMEAGAEVTVRVIYDPGTGGEHNAALQIVSNDVNEREIRVMLHGRGMAPRVCPEPFLVDFGNVSTGERPVKSFVITNCGLMDLQLLGLALSAGSSADFSLFTPPATPATLAPGAQVEVQVQYAPGGQGSDTGGVDIFSDDPISDPGSHLTGAVALVGTSIPRACDIQATPFAVTFGGVVQGQSETVSVVVSNQGSDTCTLNSTAITANSVAGEFSLVSAPADNTSFQPGDTLMVVVRYSPTDLGVDTGTLSLFGTDKDTGEIRVDLNGEGIQDAVCDLVVTPTDVKFGTIKVGQTATRSIQLTNQGQGICHITALELKQSMTFPGDFSITAAPPLPLTLNKRGQPNAQAEVEITMAPTGAKQHSGALRITSDDPDLMLSGGGIFDSFICQIPPLQLGQACIPISGYSDMSEIEVVPAELDFGVVTVGCNSPELHVTVYNLGGTAMGITDIYLENPQDPNFEIRSMPATPYTLAGGGNFQVRLRYHPQDTSSHRSNLIIESDASNAQMLSVPLYGSGTNITDQTDIFTQPTEVMSDVLFVIDNSGSMGEEQSALASNFSSFIQYATSLQASYHIGVVTTEVQSAESNRGDPPRDIIPGVLVQAPSRPKIITNGTPNLQAAFEDNVSVGTCCSDEQEAGLEAAWMTLGEPNISDPAKNGGFLRDDAKLYIIVLSDEQDQSKGNPDFYVDFFRSIKGPRNTDMMRFSAIVGDSPNGCQGNGGTAETGSRYIEVANQTGGIFESICTANWAQTLQNLGFDVFSPIREFPLSRPADASTITVTVDGVSVPQASSAGGANGWTYYADTNSVYFGDNVVPERGDEIVIHYTAACL